MSFERLIKETLNSTSKQARSRAVRIDEYDAHNMSECDWYTCTYSRQLTRLNKTYTDGFLCLRNDNHVRLFAESDLSRPIDSAFVPQATKQYVDAESDGRVIEKFHVRCDPNDKLPEPPPAAARPATAAPRRHQQQRIAYQDADNDGARVLPQTLISRPFKRPRTEANASVSLQQPARAIPPSMMLPRGIISTAETTATQDDTTAAMSLLFPDIVDTTDNELFTSQASSDAPTQDEQAPMPVRCHPKHMFATPSSSSDTVPLTQTPLPLFDLPLASNLTHILQTKPPFAPIDESGMRSAPQPRPRLTFRLNTNHATIQAEAARQERLDDDDDEKIKRPSSRVMKTAIVTPKKAALLSFSSPPHSATPPTAQVVAPVRSCLLSFPSLTTRRLPFVPDTFSSPAQYASTFQALILEQVNAQLQSTSKRFLACYRALLPDVKSSSSRPSPSRDVQSEYRRHKIAYYDSKHTSIIRVAAKKKKWTKANKKRSTPLYWRGSANNENNDEDNAGNDDTDADDDSDEDETANKFWLKVDSRHRDSVMPFARGDLWILSSHPHLMTQETPLSSSYHCLFVTSLYHSFANNTLADGYSSMQVKLVPIQANTFHMTSHSAKVYGVRLGNFSSDMAVVDALAALSVKSLPILPIILSGKQGGGALPPLCDRSVSAADIAAVHEELANVGQLNADQFEVVNRCIRWLQDDHSSERPIQLVHGVFGSGKSFTLVCIVLALSRLLDVIDPKRKIRLLITALTNVAVDNVLTALKRHGFDDFCRIGVLKRVAKPVLQHVLHHADNGTQDEADQVALKELREELRRVLSAGECDGAITDDVRYLTDAIRDLSESASKSRARRLKSRRVVGTTCASAMSTALTGQAFSIVLLDECSQMTEPASLIPMARFACQRLVAVGDPKQLPPTLQDINDTDDASDGARALLYRSALSRTLFVRLQSAGLETIMLRRQYRCHPAISRIANELFYENQLLDGVDEQQRRSLFIGGTLAHDDGTEKTCPSLPPLVFVHVNGREVKQSSSAAYSQQNDESGSTYNEDEVDAVTTIVRSLLTRGIAAQQIGVITFYKAQQIKLRAAVADITTRDDDGGVQAHMRSSKVSGCVVAVATVDSFQGGEFDIIVLSTTRTSSIGFAADPQRMNVALSRARHHLIIVGHAHCLQTADDKWKCVLASCRRQTSSYHPNLSSLMALLSRTSAVEKTLTMSARRRVHLESFDEDSEQQSHDEVLTASAVDDDDGGVAEERVRVRVPLLLDDDDECA